MFLKSILIVLSFQVCFTQETKFSYSYTDDVSNLDDHNDYYDTILSLYTLNEKYKYSWIRQIINDYNSFLPSSAPTYSPSSAPTGSPSNIFTILPSNVPTSKTSFRPTYLSNKLKVPTFQPTYQPNYTFDPYNISSDNNIM
jgi:hypothetical protein